MIPLEELRALPHAYIEERLLARIADDERRGTEPGGRTEYLAWAQLGRRAMAEHRPSASTQAAPCVSCGEPWPCPTVHSVLADD